jgi:hypothetical protein
LNGEEKVRVDHCQEVWMRKKRERERELWLKGEVGVRVVGGF